MLEVFLLAWIAIAAAQATPGPNLVATAGYTRFARGFEAVFTASFGALGGKLIFDGVKELRV